MSFLLDTDTCSAYLRGTHLVANKMTQYSGRLFLSAIAAGELFTWAFRANASPKRLQSLLDLLVDVSFLPVDMDIARKFGEIRAQQFDQGITTGEMDLFLAATALVHDLTLVTHNTADFVNVPGLRLVDWLIP
ncbi:MAG: type II toxin-antitoxin system VapC family toxin [Gemmataceae bacterium]|nr:type II toxin-antitoxin system VapC family toxin [Gemmataceae bacterium]